MSDGVVGVTATRWRRYGHDRLYVTAADGTKVGWCDLKTGAVHAESPELVSTVLAELGHWRERATPQATPGPRAPESALTAAQPSAPRPWIDLAGNRAGAVARGRAIEERQAAPVKTMVSRAFGVRTDERSWRVGAAGEEKVGHQLDKLVRKNPGWCVLHSIPVGDRGSDIDHLVIGPGGVFTINTKHHPGAKVWVGGNTFLVNGHHQPYLRNSRHEAGRASRLLSSACGFEVPVHALLAVVNAAEIVVKTTTPGVDVVPRRQLVKWLERHGRVLSPYGVAAIHDAARRSITWRP